MSRRGVHWGRDAYGNGTGIGGLMRREMADEGSGKMSGKNWFKLFRPRTGVTASSPAAGL